MSSLCPTHVQLMSESGHQLDIGFTFSLGLQSGSKFQFSMSNYILFYILPLNFPGTVISNPHLYFTK